MEVVGRGDEDGVDRRFLLEHDPEVFVRRALVVRRLGGVVLFNLLFHRPAARLAGVVPVREIPLLRRIGERDDLAIVLLEEGTRIGPALSAGADDRHVHLVTGRDEALAAKPAKDVAGHDGEPGCGGGRCFDELSARGRRLLVHMHPPRRRRLTGPGDAHILDRRSQIRATRRVDRDPASPGPFSACAPFFAPATPCRRDLARNPSRMVPLSMVVVVCSVGFEGEGHVVVVWPICRGATGGVRHGRHRRGAGNGQPGHHQRPGARPAGRGCPRRAAHCPPHGHQRRRRRHDRCRRTLSLSLSENRPVRAEGAAAGIQGECALDRAERGLGVRPLDRSRGRRHRDRRHGRRRHRGARNRPQPDRRHGAPGGGPEPAR